jgi:hypothetical protein
MVVNGRNYLNTDLIFHIGVNCTRIQFRQLHEEIPHTLHNYRFHKTSAVIPTLNQVSTVHVPP